MTMAATTIPCPTQMIETGFINSGTIPPSGGSEQTSTTFSVTFSKSFTSAPFVMAVAQSNNRSWGNGTFYVCSVSDISESGCTIRVGNLSSGTITLSGTRCVKWIAVGF